MTRKQSLELKKKMQEQIINIIEEKGIQEGDTFSSKKALYDELGIRIARGSNATTIDKILSTILSYEKTSGDFGPNRYQIKITKILEEPQELKDNRRSGGNSIYSKLIETILTAYMVIEDQKTYSFTFPDLYKLLGMCNEYYYDYEQREKITKYDARFTRYEMNSFFSGSSSAMKKILLRALNNMKARSLIDFTKEIIIVKQEKTYIHYAIATDDEIQEILEIQRQVLKKNNCENIYNAFVHMGADSFYHQVNEIIKEKHGWLRYYEQIKINTVPQLYLSEALEKDLEDLDAYIHKADITKIELNENIQELLISNAQNEVIHEKEKLQEQWQLFKEGKLELKGLYANYDVYESINRHKPEMYAHLQAILVKLFISLQKQPEQQIFELSTQEIKENKDLQNLNLLGLN